MQVVVRGRLFMPWFLGKRQPGDGLVRLVRSLRSVRSVAEKKGIGHKAVSDLVCGELSLVACGQTCRAESTSHHEDVLVGG